MKTQREKSCEADLINTRNLHVNVDVPSSSLLKNGLLKESKRDAGKPLYLARYE